MHRASTVYELGSLKNDPTGACTQLSTLSLPLAPSLPSHTVAGVISDWASVDVLVHSAQSNPRTPGARIHTVTRSHALHLHTRGRPMHTYTSCLHDFTELLTFVKPSVYVTERDAVHWFELLEEPLH